MKKLILFFTLLLSTLSYSQTHVFHNYRGTTESYISFKYKNQYYQARPKGLKAFLNENKMDSNLKLVLTEKMKKIRNKDLISNIAGWGLWATGGAIMINEALTKNNKGEKLNSNTLFKGLGIAAIGALLKELIRPKDRHYNDFINTFNRKQSDKIKFDIGLNFQENLNFGIAINF